MRAPEKTTIGAYTYEVTPLPAGQALKTLARLLRLLAPGLGHVGSLRPAVMTLARITLGGLADALMRLSGDELDALCRELAEPTMVHGPGGAAPFKLAAQFDVHFQGEMLALGEWLGFAVAVNYGPLLLALGEKLPRATPSAPAAPAPAPAGAGG